MHWPTFLSSIRHSHWLEGMLPSVILINNRYCVSNTTSNMMSLLFRCFLFPKGFLRLLIRRSMHSPCHWTHQYNGQRNFLTTSTKSLNFTTQESQFLFFVYDRLNLIGQKFVKGYKLSCTSQIKIFKEGISTQNNTSVQALESRQTILECTTLLR